MSYRLRNQGKSLWTFETSNDFIKKDKRCPSTKCRRNNEIFITAVEEAKLSCEAVRNRYFCIEIRISIDFCSVSQVITVYRRGLASLLAVLSTEIRENHAISVETQRLINQIDEREKNIERLRSEVFKTWYHKKCIKLYRTEYYW